jgi:hypothetical protein
MIKILHQKARIHIFPTHTKFKKIVLGRRIFEFKLNCSIQNFNVFVILEYIGPKFRHAVSIFFIE